MHFSESLEGRVSQCNRNISNGAALYVCSLYYNTDKPSAKQNIYSKSMREKSDSQKDDLFPTIFHTKLEVILICTLINFSGEYAPILWQNKKCLFFRLMLLSPAFNWPTSTNCIACMIDEVSNTKGIIKNPLGFRLYKVNCVIVTSPGFLSVSGSLVEVFDTACSIFTYTTNTFDCGWHFIISAWSGASHHKNK